MTEDINRANIYSIISCIYKYLNLYTGKPFLPIGVLRAVRPPCLKEGVNSMLIKLTKKLRKPKAKEKIVHQEIELVSKVLRARRAKIKILRIVSILSIGEIAGILRVLTGAHSIVAGRNHVQVEWHILRNIPAEYH